MGGLASLYTAHSQGGLGPTVAIKAALVGSPLTQGTQSSA